MYADTYVYVCIYTTIKFIFTLGVVGMYSLCVGISSQDILASKNMLSLWVLDFKGVEKGRADQMVWQKICCEVANLLQLEKEQ